MTNDPAQERIDAHLDDVDREWNRRTRTDRQVWFEAWARGLVTSAEWARFDARPLPPMGLLSTIAPARWQEWPTGNEQAAIMAAMGW